MIEITDILDVEKYIDDVDAVIFDLDDTLYSEKDYVKSGFHAVAEYFGIHSMAEEMWLVFEQHGKPIDEMLEIHGFAGKKSEALHTYRFHKPDIILYQGIAEMLTRIEQSKRVGIITDGRPEGQRAKLDALGLNDYEVIVTDELGGADFRKPNDTAFRLMQSRLQIPFEKMVYVGDNIQKDFIAPMNLKMKCIWFRNKDGLYDNK